MKKKIVIAGGTGFIGKYLTEQFRLLGYDVFVIARSKGNIMWSDTAKITDALESAEIVINLAGKSVNCRYNETNKTKILTSRTKTTQLLGEAILRCKTPPKLWINSSTATIYRHAEDRPMTESGGDIGRGFSVDVATKWEETFFRFKLSGTRQVALRMAIVLGTDGGVIQPLKNLVRFGLGGVQGSGRQMFSWIHIEDLFQIICFIQSQQQLTGIFNCSSPHPITNKKLMQIFRQVMGSTFGLPSPAWLLEIGAVFIRTETELVLKSRWVIPDRLLEANFNFKFPTIEEALEDLLINKRQ